MWRPRLSNAERGRELYTPGYNLYRTRYIQYSCSLYASTKPRSRSAVPARVLAIARRRLETRPSANTETEPPTPTNTQRCAQAQETHHVDVCHGSCGGDEERAWEHDRTGHCAAHALRSPAPARDPSVGPAHDSSLRRSAAPSAHLITHRAYSQTRATRMPSAPIPVACCRRITRSCPPQKMLRPALVV